MHERPLRVGDRVELLPGALVPRGSGLQPGDRGRVVVNNNEPEAERTPEVTVLFGRYRRPIRMHRRWLRLVGR